MLFSNFPKFHNMQIFRLQYKKQRGLFSVMEEENQEENYRSFTHAYLHAGGT